MNHQEQRLFFWELEYRGLSAAGTLARLRPRSTNPAELTWNLTDSDHYGFAAPSPPTDGYLSSFPISQPLTGIAIARR